jgi:hypothetical protein
VPLMISKNPGNLPSDLRYTEVNGEASVICVLDKNRVPSRQRRVGAAGLEPATSWSQTRRATVCATP